MAVPVAAPATAAVARATPNEARRGKRIECGLRAGTDEPPFCLIDDDVPFSLPFSGVMLASVSELSSDAQFGLLRHNCCESSPATVTHSRYLAHARR